MATAAPFDAKALYEYRSEHADDLSFGPEQIIHVTEVEDDEWLSGWYEGPKGRCQGMFPKNYVEVLPAVPVPPRPQARPSHSRSKSIVEEKPEDVSERTAVVPPTQPIEPVAKKAVVTAESEARTEQERIQPTAKVSTMNETEDEGHAAPATAKPIEASSKRPLIDTQTQAPMTEATQVQSPRSSAAEAEDSSRGPEQSLASPDQSKPKPAKPNAFRDRIAAFNKAESAPIVPRAMAKPVLAKKPFIAPPPSKDSYVPHIASKTRAASTTESSPVDVPSRPMDVPDASSITSPVEGAPKIGSLKDRIAALQAEREQLAVKKASSKPAGDAAIEETAKAQDEIEEEEEADRAASLPVLQPLTRTSTSRSIESVHSEVRPLSRQPSARAGSFTAASITGQDEEVTTTQEQPKEGDELHDAKDSSQLADADEQELDEEEQRKQRLRERMARMSGMGMGMHMALGLPAVQQKSRTARPEDEQQTSAEAAPKASVPVIPMPGLPSAPPAVLAEGTAKDDLGHTQAIKTDAVPENEEVDDSEDEQSEPLQSSRRPSLEPSTPLVLETGSPSLRSPMSPGGKSRMSYFGPVSLSGPKPTSPGPMARASAPPVPQSARPPAPAPPIPASAIPPSAREAKLSDSTVLVDSEREGYEADADDDTDTTSTHDQQRMPNWPSTETPLPQASHQSVLPRGLPPVPVVPQGVPPVPEMPAASRSLPPPMTAAPAPPVSRAPPPLPDAAPPTSVISVQESDYQARDSHEDQSSADDGEAQLPEMPSHARRLSTMRGHEDAKHRQSIDATRSLPRQSVETRRDSFGDYLSKDVSFGSAADWAKGFPALLSQRQDLVCDVKEHTDAEHSTTTRDACILFQDHSQLIVSVVSDSNSGEVLQFDQVHRPPPALASREKLEAEHERYGNTLLDKAKRLNNTVVANGDALTFVSSIVKSLPGAIPPIGARTFGAPVYLNLANASVTVQDEIRPGDIIAFRNAKFTGHKGAMKSKYSLDVGKPDHCAIVIDWDGTKKKVRVYEQGREGKKVSEASYKLKDLRSGEVKVFRAVSWQYCGW
ncbi:hypothetical protein BCR37DRAFT_378578 [Protomyces lactucae-debilis]|uniref:SH3 domain-containing protein n=1 Tax=Protomyces lactucae-debilis TaxID=2754530 RepID=A0A1Y2FI38_PROLT|nr:uncharacterized protein BCR37DRAFT_378578 [Protomyces lactucae-debilis]ORY83610.1 hypothetical protein BCR37DRAFT_378578 [Protomyces lactucae-debilis]